jgi:hypothetical protein
MANVWQRHEYVTMDGALARHGGTDRQITDPDDLPANVLAQRPKSNAFYCTQFFPVGDL